MATTQGVPAGIHTITPHIICAGAAAAIEFYKQAFGAVEVMRLAGPQGKLMHACIKIGDSAVMLVDENPEWQCLGPNSLKGTPVTLHMYVADADAAFAQAIKAGASARMEPADMFWGDRYGIVTDPYGHQWAIATHVRDVTPQELQAGAAQGCPGAD